MFIFCCAVFSPEEDCIAAVELFNKVVFSFYAELFFYGFESASESNLFAEVSEVEVGDGGDCVGVVVVDHR